MKKDAERKLDRQIGRRLRELRIMRGLSLEQLGSAIDRTFQAVQKYEAGIDTISPWKLTRFAEIFGVPVTSFFEEAEMAPGDIEKPRTRLMALMRKLRRIEGENPEAFAAMCNMANALSRDQK